MAVVTQTVEVREKPILFSGPMVKAILENRKTMTRRVVKPMPFIDYPTGFRLQQQYKLEHHPKCSFVQAGMLCDCQAIYEPWKNERIAACPYGKPGDRLWVRETWAETTCSPNGRAANHVVYRADSISGTCPSCDEERRWRPSIFMPRWASRITLEVTDVRVEQINRISLGDIEAEGTPEGIAQSQRNDGYARYLDFKVLWNSINEKRGFGWDKQPWVWCISFKRVEPVLAESEGV